MEKEKKWTYWNFLSELIPENIATRSEEEKHYFLKQWEGLTVTKNVQSPDNVLQNITDLPPIGLQQVPEWIMDRVKEAADDYVRGRWLSSIALCGVIGEFLSFHLLENYVRDSGIDEVVRFSKRLGSQEGRLKTLKELRVLKEEEWKALDSIRKIRNEYVHLNRAGSKMKEDSLKTIRNLVEFLNQHQLFLLKF
jgi:hypothetical protein